MVSVVMPSYNERENIAEAILRIDRCLGSDLAEIIVVDDDSPDGTWEVVQQMNHPRCRLIRRCDQKGLASALAAGTQAAKGDVVVWLDCDLGIPPEAIPCLLEKLPAYDIAIGSRYVSGGKDNRTKMRVALSTFFNLFYTRLILGPGVRDYTSGFAAVKKEVLQQVPLPSTGFGDYFIEWIYRAMRQKFRIAEVGYVYSFRKAGVSKTEENLFTFLCFGLSYSLRVLQTRWRNR